MTADFLRCLPSPARRRALASWLTGISVFGAQGAFLRDAEAGDFDARGIFSPSLEASDFEDFDAPERFLPDDAETKCQLEAYELLADGTALSGDSYARISVKTDCAERFSLDVLPAQVSYRASLWIRHGSAGARITVSYPPEANRPIEAARLAPTGRATSDGWVELASNDLSIDGTLSPNVYLRFVDFASADGVDLDALELVPSGTYVPPTACSGARDPSCGSDAVCISGSCVAGGPNVPPLPVDELRDGVVDALRGRLETFYGGRKTRLVDLPVALATIERMRSAPTAWQFWNGYARAVRELHDWHTRAGGAIQESAVRGRLNVCFVEGDADLSRDVFPAHPFHRDVLVSHVGTAGHAGLRPGDRLVAVDGQHPIEWARGLIDVDWGYHVASDSESFADFAEALGGPSWSGALILRYARELSVVRCDPETNLCSDVVETIQVADLPSGGPGQDVACDNRPFYHLGNASPNANNHYVFFDFFSGRVEGTTEEEAIYGLVWDTLYGGGDPNGFVNGNLRTNIANWKQNAKGVILDHRAGNGGTLDAPELLTQLVRPEEVFAVVRMPIAIAGYAGPETAQEGKDLFQAARQDTPYTVGSPDFDPDLPVALVLHRDGSASDYLPLGMKGAPRTKLFGPGPTAGAFSTFIQFSYWGGLSFQLASGDTITKDGEAMIGKGVRPDYVVQQRQSDLLAGLDSIHEAALAWIRQEQNQ
jgi:hypothetical protein